MSNLAPQNDVLNLTPNKTSTTSSSFSKTSKNKEHESSDSKNSTQDDTESFLNSLLNSIDETNEFLPDHMKISQKEVVNEAMSRLQKGAFDESDKISIFESASFMQILSLLDKLKTDTADVKLANLSTQLSSLIKTEANFNALKGASNLSELLDIAKDLGLNVKNIKVDRLLDLKATFPNLDKADFFKGAVDNVFKEIINNKISNVSKNLNHNLQNTTHTTSTHSTQKTNSKDSGSLLSQTLKNLDSILSSKESKHEKNDKVKSKIEEDVTDAKNTLKNIKNDEFAKNLTEELNIKDKEKTYARWVQYVNEYEEGATLYEGFEEVFVKLEEARIIQAVVSAKTKAQYQIDMVEKGLDKYMKATILAEDTDKHKPDPTPLLECLKRLQLQPDEVIYIGDARSDELASQNAHIDFGYAKWGNVAQEEMKNATIVLEKPLDLLQLI